MATKTQSGLQAGGRDCTKHLCRKSRCVSVARMVTTGHRGCALGPERSREDRKVDARCFSRRGLLPRQDRVLNTSWIASVRVDLSDLFPSITKYGNVGSISFAGRPRGLIALGSVACVRSALMRDVVEWSVFRWGDAFRGFLLSHSRSRNNCEEGQGLPDLLKKQVFFSGQVSRSALVEVIDFCFFFCG